MSFEKENKDFEKNGDQGAGKQDAGNGGVNPGTPDSAAPAKPKGEKPLDKAAESGGQNPAEVKAKPQKDAPAAKSENHESDSSEQPAINEASEKTEPKEAEPGKTKPKDTEPKETKPGKTKPEETESEEAKPGKTKPEETESEEAKPVETEPNETKQEETKSEETEPEETEPEEVPTGAFGKVRAVFQGNGCLRWAFYGFLILLCSVLIAVAGISTVNDITGSFKPDKSITVTVPKGAKSAGIARVLKKDGVIKNGFMFQIYLKIKKVSDLKYGTFALNSDMGYADIVAALRNPDNDKSIITVTIPEGYTLSHIANVLEQNNVCKSDDFINALENDTFSFSFDSSIPNTGNRYYKYEGYLFPDTYGFYLNEPAHQVAQAMLSDFQKKVGASLAAKAKAQGMTFDQALTLASIIQIESSNPAHMREVSSVFHNRLSKGTGKLKYLQSDSTYFYVQNNLLRNASASVQKAYNTYDSAGLPPGPICNPGLEAMNAALNPASTGYFYFVTDASGNYYFAVTGAQHNANVAKAKANPSSK